MPLEQITRDCRQQMDKSVEHFDRELRGMRTGRATTALIDYVKVDYYGSATDLRELAAISVPEPTRLLVKPFDPTSVNTIVKALETADLGLNPQADGPTIRISVPPPSAERRKQLVNQVRRMAEDARVAVRNERRDAMRQIDQTVKDKTNHVSEDQGKDAREEIEELTREHIKLIDEHCDKKAAEIVEI
ncbi:MAG: ribosome recycling factor [Planctomycetota bacterium]|nr:ribosome recycling factor [Planctomycetota bacterium]